MNCFPCFRSKKCSGGNGDGSSDNLPVAKPMDPARPLPLHPRHEENHHKRELIVVDVENDSCTTKNFTFRELAMATKNFRKECLLGEGGFGRVYKGTLQGSGKVVAVRQLDRNGLQQSNEFVAEVANFNLLEHPNLVKLVGYCADGEQRLLVYELMPKGSLKDHLYELPKGGKPLDWNTRMKIASGIAQGLEYLHEKINPPIVYRDLKSSNILLDEANNARLSKHGLANLIHCNNKMNVMASHGCCAPEYKGNGELTIKSDVYSFGIVLLELISGRKAFDPKRPKEEQNLVTWAQPMVRDQKKFPDLADPYLRKGYPLTSLNQAVGIAAMCLQEEPFARPLISDISAALSFLAMIPPVSPEAHALDQHSLTTFSSENSGSLHTVTSSFTDSSISCRTQLDREEESKSSSSDGESSDCSDDERVCKTERESKKISSSASKHKSKKQHGMEISDRDVSKRSRHRNGTRPRPCSKPKNKPKNSRSQGFAETSSSRDS